MRLKPLARLLRKLRAMRKSLPKRDQLLLRSNLTGEDPAVLWTRYVQLTQIESFGAQGQLTRRLRW